MPRHSTNIDIFPGALEARFGGKIPEEIRKGLSDLYALADGFSVVFGPASLPDPMDLTADRDEWEERGAIGYQLLPLERTLQWIEPFKIADDSGPRYAVGAIRQLSTSDFAAGIKPDTGAAGAVRTPTDATEAKSPRLSQRAARMCESNIIGLTREPRWDEHTSHMFWEPLIRILAVELTAPRRVANGLTLSLTFTAGDRVLEATVGAATTRIEVDTGRRLPAPPPLHTAASFDVASQSTRVCRFGTLLAPLPVCAKHSSSTGGMAE